jgi:hypothetical protein
MTGNRLPELHRVATATLVASGRLPSGDPLSEAGALGDAGLPGAVGGFVF